MYSETAAYVSSDTVIAFIIHMQLTHVYVYVCEHPGAAMLTTLMDGLLCCLTGKSANVVVPIETSEPADGYEFVEVKPGRVLRVRHVIPEREVEEEPSGPGGSVHCKRKITVYRNGQLLIENLGDAVRQELLHAPNGEAEPNCTVEVELADPPSNPTPNPDTKVDKTGSVVGTGEGGAGGTATAPAPILRLAPDLTQQPGSDGGSPSAQW